LALVVAHGLVALDLRQQFGRFGSDISLRARVASAALKVPVAAPLDGLGGKGAFFGKGVVERCIRATRQELGVGRLRDQRGRCHHDPSVILISRYEFNPAKLTPSSGVILN
jgi:hypothetical protein